MTHREFLIHLIILTVLGAIVGAAVGDSCSPREKSHGNPANSEPQPSFITTELKQRYERLSPKHQELFTWLWNRIHVEQPMEIVLTMSRLTALAMIHPDANWWDIVALAKGVEEHVHILDHRGTGDPGGGRDTADTGWRK